MLLPLAQTCLSRSQQFFHLRKLAAPEAMFGAPRLENSCRCMDSFDGAGTDCSLAECTKPGDRPEQGLRRSPRQCRLYLAGENGVPATLLSDLRCGQEAVRAHSGRR